MRIIRDDFVDFGTGLSGLALTNEELSELHFGARIGVVAGDAPPHRDRRIRFADGAERLGLLAADHQHPVGDQEGGGPAVIGDDPEGHVLGFAGE